MKKFRIFCSTDDWKHAQSIHHPHDFRPFFLSILAAFHSPPPTHIEVRKQIEPSDNLAVFLHRLFWKPGFKYFKAFST